MSQHPGRMRVATHSGADKSPLSLPARVSALLLSLMLAGLAQITPVSAATITVGNTGDPAIGNPVKCSVANTCTLRDAIARAVAASGGAAGDTIVFSLPANATITLSGSELLVDKNLTIDGSTVSGLAISANKHSRVFKIVSGVTVSLTRLVIKSGYVVYPERGGGIENSGNLMLINSTVSDSTAAFGGGISNDNGTLTLAGSTASNNTSIFEGGGIWSLGGTLTLTNSTLSSNGAGSGGGGIYLILATAALTDSNVSSNTSGDGGGGIYNNSGILTLNNTTILNNIAASRSTASSGGGIQNRSGTATLTNCTISGNATTGSFSGGGGGISSFGSLVLMHSIVVGNAANDFGPGGGILSSGTLTLIDITVSMNTTTSYGGGISNFGNLTLTSSTVSGNMAGTDGGGIYNSNQTLALTDSTVSGNIADNGGGIHNANYGTVTLANSAVIDNSASDGGGIYSKFYAIVLLTNSTVSNNKANRKIHSSGGGIYNDFGSTVTLTDSEVRDNTSTYKGGGVVNLSSGNYSAFALVRSTISGNTVQGNGGGIYNNSLLTLTGSTVSNNTATDSGGGINNDGSLTLNNSTLSGNAASGIGGGIYNNNSLMLVHGTIAGNTYAIAGTNDDIYNTNSYNETSVVNTIVQSCSENASSAMALSDNGGNLDGGSDCGFTDASSASNATLDLGALADNGGQTQTMLPGTGSDAIGQGLLSVCRQAPVNSRDQRGYVRPAVGCTSGAVDPNGLANESIFFDGFGFAGQ